MIKTLLGQVGEYKKDSILTPVFTAASVMQILSSEAAVSHFLQEVFCNLPL